QLWFAGRADNQVKLRGHRIELEEIDLVIEAMEGVSKAVAVVLEGSDGPELRVGFVGRETIKEVAILDHCRSRLPIYMQPISATQFDVLPQNANGKVDRKATGRLLRSP